MNVGGCANPPGSRSAPLQQEHAHAVDDQQRRQAQPAVQRVRRAAVQQYLQQGGG